MDILIWILIVVCFALSFVGIIFPLVPSPLVLWIGFLLYFFFIDGDGLSWIFWTAMAILTVVLIVSDIIANSYFVKKYGGSKWGERIAAIGVIVGSFIIPPFGIIIVPFVAVLVTELVQKKDTKESFRAAVGSLLGFLGGAFAKVIIQLLMIGWFILAVII
ncbi:DUF456 family protein [Aquibacillus koreensis]|uniref:DUF456 family protein n=1 Tax=Aquibacillus koreensis TaxID=279446 RepID=A0A9X3WP92_9BACI|nr:DUF456 family protein [Aquibacillus koreensis]MCT2536223.1 DUF456 family protein [Aquibacillus koreensis]MDC3422223.1 DUF456 family protein [Aquibacillus koreensis]